MIRKRNGNKNQNCIVKRCVFFTKRQTTLRRHSRNQLISVTYLVLRSMYQQNIATNHWHMLSAAHILWFMNKGGCLHKYSNQGWEALNRLVIIYLER